MVTAFVVTPALWIDGSQRDRAEAWARNHQTSLPATVEQLALFPPEYQDAVFGVMADDAKARLWKNYLQSTAERHPLLTARQRALLREFAGAITPADFAPNGRPNPVTLALLAETEAALGRHAAIVAKSPWRDAPLAADPRAHSFRMMLAAARVRIVEYLGMSSAVSARAVTMDSGCDCFVDGDGRYDCPGDETWRKYCLPDVDNGRICQVNTSGCDLFRNHPCDGACGYATGGGGDDGGGGGGGCDGGYDENYYCSPEYQCCE